MSKTNIISFPSFPSENPDAQEMILDGKREIMLSTRGVVLFCLSAWKVDGNEKAHNGLRRYCEYIAIHGYQGGASAAFAELDGLDEPQGIAWVKRTFAKYVQDQNSLIQYVMGPLFGGQ